MWYFKTLRLYWHYTCMFLALAAAAVIPDGSQEVGGWSFSTMLTTSLLWSHHNSHMICSFIKKWLHEWWSTFENLHFWYNKSAWCSITHLSLYGYVTVICMCASVYSLTALFTTSPCAHENTTLCVGPMESHIPMNAHCVLITCKFCKMGMQWILNVMRLTVWAVE